MSRAAATCVSPAMMAVLRAAAVDGRVYTGAECRFASRRYAARRGEILTLVRLGYLAAAPRTALNIAFGWTDYHLTPAGVAFVAPYRNAVPS